MLRRFLEGFIKHCQFRPWSPRFLRTTQPGIKCMTVQVERDNEHTESIREIFRRCQSRDSHNQSSIILSTRTVMSGIPTIFFMNNLFVTSSERFDNFNLSNSFVSVLFDKFTAQQHHLRERSDIFNYVTACKSFLSSLFPVVESLLAIHVRSHDCDGICDFN